MPKTSKPAKTKPSTAKKSDAIVRVRDVERDSGAILRRAALGPVRISDKGGERMFHIGTIRRGDRKDPSWADAMPVALAALKRRAGRILHLASGLQIALRVQATARSPDVYYIEPGSDCLEFAALRLGGSSHDAAAFKNAVGRSAITRAVSDGAARRADARRQHEIASLQGRIATLERAAKKSADLASALKSSEAALRDARLGRKAAEEASRKRAADQDEEIQALKSRIAALDRALTKEKKVRASGTSGTAAKNSSQPEAAPSAPDEGSPAPTTTDAAA
jgi:hypothetical protein